jgi:hypothetical protein
VTKDFPKITMNIMNKLDEELAIYCYDPHEFDSDGNYYEKKKI